MWCRRWGKNIHPWNWKREEQWVDSIQDNSCWSHSANTCQHPVWSLEIWNDLHDGSWRGERSKKYDTILEIKSIFRSFRREHLPFTKPIVESISTMASQMEMKHSLDWNVLGWNQQKFLNFLTLHHRQKWWVTETYLLLFFKYLFSNLLNHAKICSFQIIDRPSVTWWNV